MHPEILREITEQRGRELRARAQQDRLARAANRARRGARRRHGAPDQADGFAIPAIPDYVDGSFRVPPQAVDEAASQPGQAPAGRAA
jgi:hypothetical protein